MKGLKGLAAVGRYIRGRLISVLTVPLMIPEISGGCLSWSPNFAAFSGFASQSTVTGALFLKRVRHRLIMRCVLGQ